MQIQLLLIKFIPMEANNDALPQQPENTKEDLQKHAPRDGFDNTGTQGYDSLKDMGYTGSSKSADPDDQQSGTGSSSEDFHEVSPATDHNLSDEDHALDSGI
jgi:hypothetical protein